MTARTLWLVFILLSCLAIAIPKVFSQSRDEIQTIKLECDETHCVVKLKDLELIARYIVKLEKECQGKTI